MSSQSIRKPGAVCQNTIGPAVLAVCAVKDPLSEPFPGPPLGRVGLGIAPQGGLVGKLKQIYVFHFAHARFRSSAESECAGSPLECHNACRNRIIK